MQGWSFEAPAFSKDSWNLVNLLQQLSPSSVIPEGGWIGEDHANPKKVKRKKFNLLIIIGELSNILKRKKMTKYKG